MAFVVSVKDHAGYCVMTSPDCSVRPGRTEIACNVTPTSCSERTESVRSESCCGETGEAEESSCSSSQAACGEERNDACGKSPCTSSDSKDKSKCCLCVPPFWSEAPVKLSVSTDHLSAPLVVSVEIHSADTYSYYVDKLLIPPWGVHPAISTSVLRI